MDAGRDAGGDVLELALAAERLGLTKEALRKRVKRGTVKSYMADGRRYVVLETPPGIGQPWRDAGSTPGADVAGLLAEVDKLTALLDTVTGERDYLRQALARAISPPVQIPEKAESLTPRPWWRRVLGLS
jgi:hypothetical protein